MYDQLRVRAVLHHDTGATGVIKVHMGGHDVFDLLGVQVIVIQELLQVGQAVRGAGIDNRDLVILDNAIEACYACLYVMGVQVMDAIAASLSPIHGALPIVPKMGSGTTDGAYWRAAGIPSYSFTGIFINPKDSFAHGLNERVPKAAVGKSLRFWRAMINELATNTTQ